MSESHFLNWKRNLQDPIVQRKDNVILWINHHPVDEC